MDMEAMRNIDIHTVDPSTLVDIRDVNVNATLPQEERMRDFVRQIKNPYCYKVGKIIVKVSFAENGATLEDRLESLLMKL